MLFTLNRTLWSMTPLFTVFLGTILLTVILLGRIWFPKMGSPQEKYTCPLITFFQGGFFTAFTYYGILMLDCVVKVTFFGIMGYGNFNYHLAPILLATFLGVLLIIGSSFIAPTWRSLATFIFTLGYSLYLFEYQYAQVGVEEDVIFYGPLLICLGAQLGILVLGIIINLIQKKPALDATPIWDITGKFKTKINLKALIILWVLYFTEAIMQFEGYSLLRWLTVFS